MGGPLVYSQFLDCVVYGQFPEKLTSLFKEHQLTPEYEAADAEIFRENTVDLSVAIIINRCGSKRPFRRMQHPIPLSRVSCFVGTIGQRKINPHRGWEIYPEGIYDIAMRLKNDYQNMPWFISEMAWGVRRTVHGRHGTGQ